MDDGKDTTNSIREILLDASDNNDICLFHFIERTMKSDTIRAIFSKQNQDACNKILNDLDIWLRTNNVIDGVSCTAFGVQQSVAKVYTSSIEECKTQHHLRNVLLNDFAPAIQTSLTNPLALPL
jgi:replication fork clamp-binding protein CrfC